MRARFTMQDFFHYVKFYSAITIESWETEVSGDPLVGFKPTALFELMDENLTSFHILPSGTKNTFKTVTLRAASPDGVDIFGLEGGLPPKTRKQSQRAEILPSVPN